MQWLATKSLKKASHGPCVTTARQTAKYATKQAAFEAAVAGRIDSD
jgi:hypothetical protein